LNHKLLISTCYIRGIGNPFSEVWIRIKRVVFQLTAATSMQYYGIFGWSTYEWHPTVLFTAIKERKARNAPWMAFQHTTWRFLCARKLPRRIAYISFPSWIRLLFTKRWPATYLNRKLRRIAFILVSNRLCESNNLSAVREPVGLFKDQLNMGAEANTRKVLKRLDDYCKSVDWVTSDLFDLWRLVLTMLPISLSIERVRASTGAIKEQQSEMVD
jgi:hypothetical protein